MNKVNFNTLLKIIATVSIVLNVVLPSLYFGNLRNKLSDQQMIKLAGLIAFKECNNTLKELENCNRLVLKRDDYTNTGSYEIYIFDYTYEDKNGEVKRGKISLNSKGEALGVQTNYSD